MCIRDRRCCPHSGGGLCAAARGRLPQLRLPGVLSSAARGPAGGAVTTVQAPPAGSRALRPDDLCGLLDVPLTAEQLAAATAPLEPGVIVAGAGSGKTTVMAGRVVWLVATGQVALDAELAEHLVDPAALCEHDRSLVVAIEALPKPVAALRDAAEAAQTRLELVELVEAFRAEKRRLDALDFGDQVLLGARLAENRAEVGASERDRYRVVLLDEYQDTSVGQRRMLVGLYGGGHPVTAVGDPCQGIYGWRGASVTNLDRFPEHFTGPESDPAPSYSLSENQRSGGLLLRLANAVSAVLRDVHHGVVELRPRPEVATAGSTTVALLPTYAAEMKWLAEQVQAALDAGTPAPEIAVLVRVRSDFGQG